MEAEAWAKIIESGMARGVWLSRSEAESTTLYETLTRYENEIVPEKKGEVQEHSLVRILKGTQLAKSYIASIRSADVAKLRDEWLRIYASATVLRRLALTFSRIRMGHVEPAEPRRCHSQTSTQERQDQTSGSAACSF